MTAPYPWQQVQWDQLVAARAEDRMPHALLLTAPVGTGVGEFARKWARAALCQAGDGGVRPCGRCAVCAQIEAGTHPDLVRLEPEEAGKAIGIDAVRGLIERLGLTAGGGKIALIDPADHLTLAAANSLLKTLEEPPGDSLILLVCHRPSRLPATVRSRCRQVSFGLPARSMALDWLRAQGIDPPDQWLARAGGAPLAAAALARSETGEAEEADLVVGLLETLEQGTVAPGLVARAARYPLATSVPLFTTVVADLLRVRVGGADRGRLRHRTHAERLERLAPRLDVRGLFHYLDQLNRAVPGPSSALRPDMQIQGLLADAAALRRTEAANRGGG